MRFTRPLLPAAPLRLTIPCSILLALSPPSACCGHGSAGGDPHVKGKWRQAKLPLPDVPKAAGDSPKICDKQKARSGLLERAAECSVENGRLTLYFSGFFLLRLFFLFLEFELVADELEDGYLGVVADAVAGVNDAGVAAGAIGKFRRDLA